jgi:hypothetical protein
MEDLEKKYPGLQTSFKKLKERHRLTIDDITPLQQFVDATVTCTTNIAELKKIFRPEENNSETPADEPTALRQSNLKKSLDQLTALSQSNNKNCNGECNPAKCDSCA